MVKKQLKLLLLDRLSAGPFHFCHLQSRNSLERRTPETNCIMIFQKITHFRQSSLLFCNSELSLYAEKIPISVFRRQIYCWMRNCFPAFVFSVIQAASKSNGKLVFALQFFARHHGISSCREHLQLSRAPSSCPGLVPAVVESTHSCQEYRKNLQLSELPTAVESIFSCREHLQLSKVPPAVKSTSTCPKYLQLSRTPPVVESISSCREHLQLSKVSPVVQNTSSCQEHLQLSKVSSVVENTSSCPKYLQLSRASPVVESTPSCREHLHLSKVPPVVKSDFCQTGSVILTFILNFWAAQEELQEPKNRTRK